MSPFVIFLSRARTASQCSSRASSRASSRGASRDTSPDRRGDRRLSVERGYSPSHLPVMKKTSPLHSKYDEKQRIKYQMSIQENDFKRKLGGNLRQLTGCGE